MTVDWLKLKKSENKFSMHERTNALGSITREIRDRRIYFPLRVDTLGNVRNSIKYHSPLVINLDKLSFQVLATI